MTEIRYLPLVGRQAEQYIDELASLRIDVFRDFPYLYDGDLAYEHNYLKRYFASEASFVVLSMDGKKVVGASTGIALKDENSELQDAFKHHGYKIDDFFYFGESVLLKPYRGKGIGKAFFRYREAHARALQLRYASFCRVVRPTDHPMQPKGYQPLDQFWLSQGFIPVPGLVAHFEWKDVGHSEQTKKAMAFWIKELR